MKYIYAWTTLLLTAGFAIAPVITPPFSGFAADQLPIPQINPPVQPAGYAFAIWGLIYAWLVVSAIYGVWKRADDREWDQARLFLIPSLAVGIPWLYIAGVSPIWATITIIIMAVGAILALIRTPQTDRWLFQTPVAIYAGWLTAASFVSIGTTLAGFGILLDAYGWALACIAAALAVAIIVFRKRPSAPEYLLTVIWALVGIIVANGTQMFLVSAMAASGIVVLLCLITMWRPSSSPTV